MENYELETFKATLLDTKRNVSVLALESEQTPKLLVPIELITEIIAGLDACRGFVAGVGLKESAVKLNMLLSDIKKIREHYFSTVAQHGFSVTDQSYPSIEYEKLMKEIEDIMAKLGKLPKK